MEEPKDREKAVKCQLIVRQKMEGIDRDSWVLDTVVLTSRQLHFPAWRLRSSAIITAEELMKSHSLLE